MAMMAHEATDIAIRIAQQRLADARRSGAMKWAKPRPVGGSVFTSFLQFEIERNEGPAGDRLAVLGVGLEARLLHGRQRRFVEARMAGGCD